MTIGFAALTIATACSTLTGQALPGGGVPGAVQALGAADGNTVDKVGYRRSYRRGAAVRRFRHPVMGKVEVRESFHHPVMGKVEIHRKRAR